MNHHQDRISRGGKLLSKYLIRGTDGGIGCVQHEAAVGGIRSHMQLDISKFLEAAVSHCSAVGKKVAQLIQIAAATEEKSRV